LAKQPNKKTPHAVRARRRKRSVWERIKRMAHFQLIIPLLRSKHAPEYTARGVAMGFAIGITPTAGIQLIGCGVSWAVARKIFKWDFNVILAMAWTWNSNTFTIPPIYYICYVTGQIMLGHWSDALGYEIFAAKFHHIFSVALGWDSVGEVLQFLVTDVFLVMMLGCIPWFFLTYWLCYRWTMRFMERYHLARDERKAQKRAARRPSASTTL
jgi:uncharacterized protein (DUF2062 family)